MAVISGEYGVVRHAVGLVEKVGCWTCLQLTIGRLACGTSKEEEYRKRER